MFLFNIYIGCPLHEACQFPFNTFFHFKGEEASVPAAPTVAVIGTESSSLTMELAAMLSLFKVPVLSYLSSSVSLDDKNTYPYFSRTVPSDKMQVS